MRSKNRKPGKRANTAACLASERRDHNVLFSHRLFPDFNPLASERRDRAANTFANAALISIHSPLRGETSDLVSLPIISAHFNPLASERRDQGLRDTVRQLVVISIHSPLRGETRADQRARVQDHISIHSPLRGETNGMIYQGSYECISIHSPLRGETTVVHHGTPWYKFQSTRL